MTQREIADYLEIKPPSLSQMLNGRIAVPMDKLFKIIGLLNPSRPEVDKVKRLYFGELLETGGYDIMSPGYKTESIALLSEVPVISLAQAAGYEPALEPIDCYAKNCSDETIRFAHEMRSGYFALSVDGEAMAPEFPDGTIILVAGGEFPEHGDVVVAKLRNGRIVIKKYKRSDDIINLEAINAAGQNFEWHCKEDPGFIQWMYPVLEATIDLRRRRWEPACRSGVYQIIGFAENYAVAEDKKKYDPDASKN